MKHKISRQETIYAVALAGISAAVALLMVWLGVVVRFSTVAFFIAASIAVMVPASQKYYFSSSLALDAVGALRLRALNRHIPCISSLRLSFRLGVGKAHPAIINY